MVKTSKERNTMDISSNNKTFKVITTKGKYHDYPFKKVVFGGCHNKIPLLPFGTNAKFHDNSDKTMEEYLMDNNNLWPILLIYEIINKYNLYMEIWPSKLYNEVFNG